MKILLATIFALPSTGGLWTYVKQLKSSLEKSGHEVDVLAHHPKSRNYYLLKGNDDFSIKESEKKLTPTIIKAFNTTQPKVDPKMIKMEVQRSVYEEAAKYLYLVDYDLIHAQDIISAYALARVKPAKVPLILTVHGCYTAELLIGGHIKSKNSALWNYSSLLEYYGIASSDYTIFPSNWMKYKLINEFYVPEQNIEVIPNGMDNELFFKRADDPCTLPASEEKMVISCLARLDRIKGHRYLLEALSQLKKERRDWVCWLIGDGDLRNELEKQVNDLELVEEVLFLGSRSDIPSLLKKTDICVLPSLQENCPYSIMEAQVAGKPVIASKVGGIPEMIEHGKTGFLCEPADSEGIAEHLRLLLDDDNLRGTIASNSKSWGKTQWSLERVMNQTWSVYQKGLNAKNTQMFIESEGV